MKSRPSIGILKMGVLAAAVMLCLYGGLLALQPLGLADSVCASLASVFQDRQTQWVISSSVGVYLLIFLATGYRNYKACLYTKEIWLVVVLVMGTFAYISDYQAAGRSMRFMTFLAVIALGQSAIAWMRSEGNAEKAEKSLRQFLIVLLALLTVGVFWPSDGGLAFKYHGQVRWAGSWNNPNIYGLLMGVGVVVSCGLLAQCVIATAWTDQPKSKNQVEARGFHLKVCCLLSIAVIMSLGLLKSDSRGAWLAALSAFLYLGLRAKEKLSRRGVCSASGNRSVKSVSSPVTGANCDICSLPVSPDYVSKLRTPVFQRSFLVWAIICCSLASLTFWSLRHAEWHTAHRVFSAGNWNDFSMRNRFEAWKSSLQMMADRPWQGFGWNRTWQVYGSYFNDAKIEDAGAVQTNAYFVLGTTLGLPALLSFIIYILMTLRLNSEPRNQKYDTTPIASETESLEWAGVICHAGAIVLIVGFWFDGGLFELPTAALFWILLELGIPVRDVVLPKNLILNDTSEQRS